MKVTLVNTSDRTGGAAIACFRLLNALKDSGTDVNMLVQKKSSASDLVHSTTGGFFKSQLNFYRFALERYLFFLKEKSKEVRFAFSIGNTGEDISDNNLISQADIIHLHWVNFGFLSLQTIEKLLKLNKPVVWTLHDMWAFTGGCHYAGDCIAYQSACNNCPFLKRPHLHDISNKIWQKKQQIYKQKNLTIVTCSNWLATLARKSSLLGNFRIVTIPNPIDTYLYKPANDAIQNLSEPKNKDMKYLLFGSMNINDKRKGFIFLKNALEILIRKYPETRNIIEIMVFGKSGQVIEDMLPYTIQNLGVLKNENQLIKTYQSADLFILPSLEDNLPNTIMEALSCGIPVVAFDTGGIPEMIIHQKNGYLAGYKNAEDLANGIYWALFQSDNRELSSFARKRVLENYNNSLVAGQYLKLYRELTS